MTNRRVTLAAGLILPIALAGCVPGYNSLLFTTKTNVGFVVDTKPPEVNLDIGRQELLFAPTYEEGKTPPVMASFRFDSEKAFNNYLGSAFATGDASLAMSRLYDSEDWPEATGENVWDLEPDRWRAKEKLFDSSVKLEMVPKYPVFVPREKPGQVRPVLFGTDTSFGFKASWAGMESALPDYVRLAYQRRELAFAAVTIGPDEDKEGNINGLKARTPSLLATVDTKMEVGKFLDAKLEYLQYFASGRAATALAMRKAVREAMLRRLDPESAPQRGPSVFVGEAASEAIFALEELYDLLKKVADTESFGPRQQLAARGHIQALADVAAEHVPARYPGTLYDEQEWDRENSACYAASSAVSPQGDPRVNADFADFYDYFENLRNILEGQDRILNVKDGGKEIIVLIGTQTDCAAGSPVDETFLAGLKEEQQDVLRELERLHIVFQDDTRIEKAIEFTTKILKGT